MLVAPTDLSQVVMLLVVVFFVMIVHRYPYLGAACDCDSCDFDSANARLDGNLDEPDCSRDIVLDSGGL